MSEGYLQTKIDGKQVYVRMDGMHACKIREINAVIFDCDGVLIDIGKSCNKAISETVTYIIRELTGFPFSKSLVSEEIIHLFKESGGFNNDWDLAYALLMFAFSGLSEESQKIFEKAINTNRCGSDLFEYFLSVKKSVLGDPSLLNDLGSLVVELEDALTQFAGKLDARGLASIEKELVPSNASKGFLEYYGALKRFMSYPGDVGESPLITVFEEIFCGAQLFRKMYKVAPRFYLGEGLIENERVIVLPDKLDQLASLLGKSNLGISSGRPFELAKYTLRGRLEAFNPKALVFLDDIQAAEREKIEEKGLAVDLRKPNPFSLFASSRELEPFKFALYVGDSMEDVMMIKEAKRLDTRFLFAGVYDYSDFKEDMLRSFLKAGSEIVLPSVNELPVVLKALKEKGTI